MSIIKENCNLKNAIQKDSNIILQLRNIGKKYKNCNARSGSQNHLVVHAVKELSMDILKGEYYGLVGESGSGKSTLAKIINKLVLQNEGKIVFNGTDITGINGISFRAFRKNMQMIFQNAVAALDPNCNINNHLLEMLNLFSNNQDDSSKDNKINKALNDVRFPLNKRYSFPGELSGGESRRAAIARALITSPLFLIADEPTAGLDATIKRQIINIFRQLKESSNYTMLLISHDLDVVKNLCDRVGVMLNGRLIEELILNSDTEFRHPYSIELFKEERNEKRPFDFLELNNSRAPLHEKGCGFRQHCHLYNSLNDGQVCDNGPEFVLINIGHKVRCPYIGEYKC